MKFETQTDINRQKMAMAFFSFTYGCSPQDQGEFAEIDYLMFKNDKPYFYLEIKGVKKTTLVNTENVVVGIRKLMSLQAKYEDEKIPCVIAWAFEDGIAWQNIDKIRGNVYWGGRKPRKGSTNDQELMLSINIDNCRKHNYNKQEI